MPFCLRTAVFPRRSALAVLLNLLRFGPTRSPPDLPLTTRESSLGEKLSSKPLTQGSHHRGSLQDRLPAFQKPPLPEPACPAGRNHHPPGTYGLRNSSPISPAHPPFTPLRPATLSSSQAAGGRGRGQGTPSLRCVHLSGPFPPVTPGRCGFGKGRHRNGLQLSFPGKVQGGHPQDTKEAQAATPPPEGASTGCQDLTALPGDREDKRKSGPWERALKVGSARTPGPASLPAWPAVRALLHGLGRGQQGTGPSGRLAAEFSS